jgi:release factor glutamine methyltransferase
MPYAIKQVFFGDCKFNVSEDVYEPAEDSFLFAENLTVEDGDYVLDMGTGCGILGIVAAAVTAKVIAIDINPHAVRCAQENARLNGVSDKLFLVQGDLFTPLKTERQFDSILFNAPYLPTDCDETCSWIGRAWAGGATGRQIIDRFICESPKHLKQGGQILLMQSTLSDIEKTTLRFKKHGLRTTIVAKRDLPFFETILLIRAEH